MNAGKEDPGVFFQGRESLVEQPLVFDFPDFYQRER